MFNLRKYSSKTAREILFHELQAFNIRPDEHGGFDLAVGDNFVHVDSVDSCKSHINDGLSELKSEIFESWQDISNIASVLAHHHSANTTSLDNLLFLHSVKQSILLAQRFSQLNDIAKNIRNLLNIDISHISNNIIKKFNLGYIRIKSLHRLIINEMYRLYLLRRFASFEKQAQISGPWANLDLPMSERVWEYDEGEEEYFGDREDAIRKQPRYNPENNKSGYYYVWFEKNNDPYSWDTRDDESPYKSNTYLSVP